MLDDGPEAEDEKAEEEDEEGDGVEVEDFDEEAPLILSLLASAIARWPATSLGILEASLRIVLGGVWCLLFAAVVCL